MAFLNAIPPRLPLLYSKPHDLTLWKTLFSSCKLFCMDHRRPLSVLACSSPSYLPTTEQEFLEAVSESEGHLLPCVRSYENDSSRLTLVGAVDFEQAVTAAAADGGEAASEHVDTDLPAMVVETIFPGPSRDHSTVSTRLFLPARKVKEKAKKLRRSLDDDMLSSTTSRNILAMTFRQVVLQQIWSFELVLFKPGTVRNMEVLGNPREVPASFILSSSDKSVISQLAEVVCISALESTKKKFEGNSMGTVLVGFSHWFKRPKRIASKESAFIIYEFVEDEIGGNVQGLLDNYNSVKKQRVAVEMKPKDSWWILSVYSKLEKIGGPEFSNWACEYIPAYRLQADASRLKDIKFEGWGKSTENWWEVLLTHSQMVGLANILDMYYEDTYTLPDKAFSCGMGAKFYNLSMSKSDSSLSKILSLVFASGILFIAISLLSQLSLPHLRWGSKASRVSTSLSSEIQCPQLQMLEPNEMERFFILIVAKIKDALGWHGDIKTDANGSAWIGELPAYLMRVTKTDDGSSPGDNNADMASSAQDIASYQVVLSTDGKLIGFQPTSRVAVNHWAANPLSKELYGGRKLSPGFIEPGLKIQWPKEVIVMELLMSTNPDAHFALARQAAGA